MSAVLAVVAFIVLMIAVPLLVNLGTSEIEGWAPRWTNSLLDAAANRLAPHAAVRFREEWDGEVDALPTPISRLVLAVGIYARSWRLAGVVGPRSREALDRGNPHIPPGQAFVHPTSRHWIVEFHDRIIALPKRRYPSPEEALSRAARMYDEVSAIVPR